MLPSHILALVKQPDTNPIPTDTIPELIVKIIEYGLGIAGLIAATFIVIGGFQYITSAGNDEQSKKATKTLTGAIIGLIIILSAYAIEQTIVKNVLG